MAPDDEEYPEHGRQLERERVWERGHQGRPEGSDRDPGPANTDQAPLEYADEQGGPPQGSTVPTERPTHPQDRHPPLGGAASDSPSAASSDAATAGS